MPVVGRNIPYKARVENTKKAHIIPPMDSTKAFGDPACDNHVAVAFLPTLQLVLGVNEASDVDEVVYVGGVVDSKGDAD
ncbi:hypothetical protein IFR05_013668 [Cadophora sp. M221]|nr:hypothetical protein IFR05_013668 [Cadophora sp. M221]